MLGGNLGVTFVRGCFRDEYILKGSTKYHKACVLMICVQWERSKGFDKVPQSMCANDLCAVGAK